MSELEQYAGFDCLDSTLTSDQIDDIHWKLELSPDPIVDLIILKIRTRCKNYKQNSPQL